MTLAGFFCFHVTMQILCKNHQPLQQHPPPAPETLRIRGQAFEYVVRERGDGRVHHRSIEFESGERVDVEYGYFPRGLKRGRVIASLIPSSTMNVEAEIISAEELGNGTIIQRMSSS